MDDQTSGSRTALIVATAVVAACVVMVAGGVVMAIAMSDHIGFMHGRSDTADQTPVVSDEDAVDIAIRDFAYVPDDLTIDAGTSVTFTNEDSATHDAADRGEVWRTELLGQGDSDTIVFDAPGAFEYYCTIHPWMEATVTVR